MRKVIIFLSLIFSTQALWSQNLLSEPIRKIDTRKKSIFVDRGVFHNGMKKVHSSLRAIRHSFKKSSGYERLVFDFETAKVPRLYAYLSKDEKKLFVDFFETKLTKNIKSFGQSHFISDIQFFPMGKEVLSAELSFKKSVSIDIFYLSSPGRLVIDIKH